MQKTISHCFEQNEWAHTDSKVPEKPLMVSMIDLFSTTKEIKDKTFFSINKKKIAKHFSPYEEAVEAVFHKARQIPATYLGQGDNT